MRSPEEYERLVDLVRSRLADGAGHDEVLALLRRHGAHKMESIRVLAQAAGTGLREAKLLVHRSPVWDDRRASDEAFEERLFHSMFVLAVLGEATVTAPAEDVAECRERQRRATAQLEDVAAGLSDATLHRFTLLLDGADELASEDREDWAHAAREVRRLGGEDPK